MFKPVLKTALILMAYLALMANGALVACGTKGPLYIPEQRYPQGLEKGVEKNSDKGVNNDATKKIAPEANTDKASSPAQ